MGMITTLGVSENRVRLRRWVVVLETLENRGTSPGSHKRGGRFRLCSRCFSVIFGLLLIRLGYADRGSGLLSFRLCHDASPKVPFRERGPDLGLGGGHGFSLGHGESYCGRSLLLLGVFRSSSRLRRRR